eukprot:UN31967
MQDPNGCDAQDVDHMHICVDSEAFISETDANTFTLNWSHDATELIKVITTMAPANNRRRDLGGAPARIGEDFLEKTEENVLIHGPFKNEPVHKTCVLNNPGQSHGSVRVKLRLWLVHNWGGDYIKVWVDKNLENDPEQEPIFEATHNVNDRCGYGFEPELETLPNPWNGDSIYHKCWIDINVEMGHTKSISGIKIRNRFRIFSRCRILFWFT